MESFLILAATILIECALSQALKFKRDALRARTERIKRATMHA